MQEREREGGVGERVNASEDELTRRRRDGDDGGDRDEARTNNDQAGIEQARTARVRLGPPTSNGEYCCKRISKP